MNVLAWVRFEIPGYLALLAVLPLLLVFSYRSLAGLGPARRIVALTARCLVVLLIVLALAGVQRTEEVKDLAVVFLLDRSKSIPQELQREAFRYVARAAEEREADDRLGVIGFDGIAGVEQLPMRALEIDRITETGDADRTSLAAATRLGLALLPSDATGRIVMISDGNENVGSVLQEAQQLGAAGIPIDVLPIQYERDSEVIFEQLKAPATATDQETINLQMVLRSKQACSGKILLWHNDELLDLNGPAEGGGFDVELSPGPNRFERPVPLYVSGAHRFRAQFVPDNAADDTIADNNVGRAFTCVSGQGRILILTTSEDMSAEQSSARILADALATEKLVCEIEVAGDQVLDQVRLLDYSLVVLGNVPAGSLRDEEKQALAVYVRELGGGLIMVGGEDSFGAGGWLGSPVEEVMPVSFDVKHKKEFLKGALVLVMHACEIPAGNHIGERCAIEAVKALSQYDLVGVLAYGWQGAQQQHWTVPLQEVGDRTRIIGAIKRMSMGDLPDLDEVMRPGVEALMKRPDAGAKHMIVVSDFDPQAPRSDLINAMKDNGITCTTIAIGYGGHFIDEYKANQIAKSTGGRFERTNDYSKLPQIFIKESRVVRRSLVQEGLFHPQIVNPLSPLVAGLTGQGLPDLRGMVLTTKKDAATVPVVRRTQDQEDDPLLAHWQAGLGKTIAFTSGLWPKWGTDWTAWPGFSKFWAQAVRWASRQQEAAAFDITTSVQGGRGKIRIDAVDKQADAVNFMDVIGTLVTPEQSSERLQLTQTGPGRYEAEFDARERGNYIVNLAYAIGQGAQASRGALRTGLTVSYSPEYADVRPNLPLLGALQAQTGGRMMNANEPKAVFDRAGLQPAETRLVMWETLVRWMLLMFLVDVAVRRIAINPVAMARKVRQFVAEMAGRGRPASEAAAVLTTLKGARDRARDERRATETPRPEATARPDATARYEARPADAKRTPDTKATEDLGRALGGATQQDAPVVARPTGKKPAQSEADYTSRLLRAKRRAREDMHKDQEDQKDH